MTRWSASLHRKERTRLTQDVDRQYITDGGEGAPDMEDIESDCHGARIGEGVCGCGSAGRCPSRAKVPGVLERPCQRGVVRGG